MRPAAVAIDWSDLGQRIGDRPKPLAAATMRRIRAGIDQFAEPTVIATNHGRLGEDRAYPAARAPMPTRSTKIGDGVVCPPFLLDRRAYNDGDARRIKPISDPVGTITANGRPHTLVTPPMVVPAGGSWNTEATSAAEPIRTRMTRDTDGLFTPQPWITVLRNHADVSSIDAPLSTVATGGGTGGGHQGLTVPPGAFIQKHHGGLDYQGIAHMTKSVEDPVPSVVARPNLSLVIPYRKGKAKTTAEPLHTVATRDSAALVETSAQSTSTTAASECSARVSTPAPNGSPILIARPAIGPSRQWASATPSPATSPSGSGATSCGYSPAANKPGRRDVASESGTRADATLRLFTRPFEQSHKLQYRRSNR